MRRKSDLLSHSSFRCCFCCHVRTGTVILGIWHLILHVLALAILVSMLLRPELFHKLYGNNASGGTSVATKTSDDFSSSISVRFHPGVYNHELPDISPGASLSNIRDQDVHVALAITFCTGIITLLLLYGAIWGHANYLMPFFCLQVFDFILSTLTVVGYFSYLPDVRRLVENSRDLPLQRELLRLDPQWLCTVVMLGFLTCMLLKAYVMGMVWSCYRYLKIRQEDAVMDLESDSEALLPPDYETATKMPAYLPVYAPPPYAPTAHPI
ncbi:lysosomal-associated transmembrane protein 4A-like isoform X2 [Ornithodoros turicata]|uniref:lysosomal-associated transmembrane protein 4A-like isoform X2 n=1 Tax=Ornithodoros turicata TaxID=34597 RepID=UPI00313959E1